MVREKRFESLSDLGGVKQVSQVLESDPKSGVRDNEADLAWRIVSLRDSLMKVDESSMTGESDHVKIERKDSVTGSFEPADVGIVVAAETIVAVANPEGLPLTLV
ncbi:hypothetical protein QYF36_009587 [Acer negundo]|nr:hypothetical protein QYF36_009587 [Acer negundo]